MKKPWLKASALFWTLTETKTRDVDSYCGVVRHDRKPLTPSASTVSARMLIHRRRITWKNCLKSTGGCLL